MALCQRFTEKMVVRVVFLMSLLMFCVNCCNIVERGVSVRDQNILVNAHNRVRLMVAQGKVPGQPRASNMLRMFWDNKLAIEAQKIANSCQFSHVKVNDGRWAVGQNLYTSWTSYAKSADWSAAVNSWFNEYKFYKFGRGFSTRTGHYTQVVWAKTRFVGCGYTRFRSPNHRFQYQHLYVCNYGPAGNYVGETPYQTGFGCNNLC